MTKQTKDYINKYVYLDVPPGNRLDKIYKVVTVHLTQVAIGFGLFVDVVSLDGHEKHEMVDVNHCVTLINASEYMKLKKEGLI